MVRTRLVWRIYLYSVVFVVLPAIGIFAFKRALSEPPWKKNFERTGRYMIEEVFADRNANQRIQELLGATVAIHTPGQGPVDRERLARGESIVWIEGDRRLVAVPISRNQQLVAYGIYTAPVPSKQSNTLLFALLVALSATGVASFLLARSVTRPLAKLATTAERIGAGDLNARAGLNQRDELGAVARAFDEMAGRVGHLLRSQKELLANVSHELRTPLARIRVALDIAGEGDADGARELLGEIELDLSELERLIDDILTAARLDLGSDKASPAAPPLRLEQVAAGALVQRAAARFAGAHPGRTLTVTSEGLPEIEADGALLRRAIDNLLDNAAKYSEAPSPIILRARRSGDDLLVEVVDEGIGVDPADLPHLFTPFFRGDRSRTRRTGGVGLGLALVKRIVDAHGGRITIESAAGRTTARITVPCGAIRETAPESPTPG